MNLPILPENNEAATAQGRLETLRLISPPQAIVHIGAGTGSGDMHLWQQWQVANVLILDADENRLDWATKLTAENAGWQVYCAVLSEIEGEADYYSATNPAEDGLISPDKLVTLWPNLRISNQTLRQTQRLDHLLTSAESFAVFRQSQSIWVIIDCLSALPILQGAGNEIDCWSVLWLRVLLKPLLGVETIHTLKDIDAFLSLLGFRCIHIAEGNHPAVGEAIYVRDWQAVLKSNIEQLDKNNLALVSEKLSLEQLLSTKTELNNELQSVNITLTQDYDEQTKLAAVRQGRIEALTQECDNHTKQAQDRQAQLEALTQANSMLTQEKAAIVEKHDALAQEVAALTLACNEQTKLASERQAHIEALTQERDNHAKQTQDRQAQLETLTQEKTALVEKHDALAKEVATLTLARDEQTKFATERQARIETLTQTNSTLVQEVSALKEKPDILMKEIAALTQTRDEQNQIASQYKGEVDGLQSQLQQKEETIASLESQFAESDARQRLLNEEMIKAEAQIDLIKDVLLREPGL